jgi:hypothetical protein
VISNISANGSGSIDLRTGGTNKAIALNGATLSSTSGQVQVLASGDISTSTANGTTPPSSGDLIVASNAHRRPRDGSLTHR